MSRSLCLLLACLACCEAFAACCPTIVSLRAGTAACGAAGLRKGQLPASSLCVQRASVRLPVSETFWPKEVRVLFVSHFNIFQPCSESKVFNAWSNGWNGSDLRKLWIFQVVVHVALKSATSNLGMLSAVAPCLWSTCPSSYNSGVRFQQCDFSIVCGVILTLLDFS